MRKSIVIAAVAGMLIGCGERKEVRNEPPRPPHVEPKVEAKVVSHAEEVRQWQEKRASNLRKEDSWLTLVGLWWLREGTNSVGSSDDSVVRLISSVPAVAGVMEKSGSSVTFKAEPSVTVTSEGKNVQAVAMAPDSSGKPTILKIGTVSFYLIERGGKYGVRVKDPQSPARTGFKGLEYFPVSDKWNVKARFEPYNPPKQVPIANVIGTTEPLPSPGALVFTVDGKEYRIDAIEEEPGAKELFIIFGDETNKRETYGAGRYIYTALPGSDGTVALDFNRAYNPPCAFTPFATCPLPPKQNRLPVRIEAGEKRYEGGH